MKKIPKSELDVIKVIWKIGDEVSSRQVVMAMEEKNNWKRTTTLTLLSRLIEKGFLKSRKENRMSYFTALVDEKEYLKLETEDFLERVHNGSLESLFTSLESYKKINSKTLEEIKSLLEK